MKRRTFLHLLAASAPALACSTKLYATPETGTRFLLVFLRGGYDAANIIIPYASPFYYEARPSIAVAKPNSGGKKSAQALDADWALHPALASSVGAMYQSGQAAFIPFAGTEDVSRSHFETQDSIELGQALNGRKNYNSGFINRLVGELSGVQGISFTDTLPLSCKGANKVANLSFKTGKRPVFAKRQADILAEMYQGKAFDGYIKEGFELRKEMAEGFAAEMVQANRGAVLPKGFGAQTKRMAAMMREKYNLGFIDVGGWDTHLKQGGTEGQLANKMYDLGEGLAIFAKEMGSAWDKTVVLVISEFGRTFSENGNHGTDHGHGTTYWVLGGGIKGGRIVGEQVKVASNTLFQDRDYQVLNDYRSVMGGLFKAQFGLSEKSLQNIFPEAKPLDLKLL
jgi:uncharacterized protein (DUF1501 family)